MATAVKSNPTVLNKPLKKQNTPKSRKTYIEVMRIIAAFLVIVNHTNSNVFLTYSEPESLTWFFSIFYFFLSKIAVPVFLLIMGGLLLQKEDSPKKSFQRALRIFVVLVVFSIGYYFYLNRETPDIMSFKHFFESVFSKRVTEAFWYLYTYFGIMIMLPLFQTMAKAFSKQKVQYLIILSVGVMGTLPLLTLFTEFTLNPYITDAFFVTIVGLIFMGFYIEKYMVISKTIFYFSLFLFFAILAFEVLYTYYLWQEDPFNYLMLDNRYCLTITSCSICFYIIFKYLSTVVNTKEVLSRVVCYIGSLTFGIYLFSDFFIEMTKPYYQERIVTSEAMIPLTIVWEIVIFVAGAIVTAVLRLIPGVKKYI